jgi:CRP/FNR family transcriptional regulator, cyclic AMP receptor protein
LTPVFNTQAFLNSSGITKTIVEYGRGETIFTQGDTCENVLYIQTGGVKLSALSKNGREVVVTTLGPGDFFGEGCLAGQRVRMRSATAITPSVILLVARKRMAQLLHERHAMTDRFIAHMLLRSIRLEEDLLDQIFNPIETRLARALLRMAHYGTERTPVRAVPDVSEETLAERVGTTSSVVNVFLTQFKRSGFIEYNKGSRLKINRSLLRVVLHD